MTPVFEHVRLQNGRLLESTCLYCVERLAVGPHLELLLLVERLHVCASLQLLLAA